ncbi:MAG: oligosaccharide flippase family protein [Thermoplasmatota archaeon]
MEDATGDGANVANVLFTSISRKTLLILINFVIMGLIGIISWKVISTNISQENVGIVRFALGFLGTFSFITNLGFGASHVKRISEGKDIGLCIGTFLTIQIFLVFVFVGVVVGSIFAWKNIIGMGFQTPHHENVIYLMMGFFVANNLATVGFQTFVGKVEIAKNQITVLSASFLQLISTIMIAVFFDDPYWLAVTFLVGAIANFVIAFILLSRYPIKKPTKAMIKSYFIFALPIFIISALGTLPPNIDSVLIQLFWDAKSVAIYRGGQIYSQYLIQISAGLGMILFPIFSKLKTGGKDQHIKEIIYKSERLMAMVVAPLASIIFALSIPIVTLLGSSDYRASYLVLQPMVVWAYMKAMISPYWNLIMGVGKPKVLAIVSIVSVLSIVLLDLIFIPTDIKFLNLKLLGLGAAGAAYATLLSAGITFLLIRSIAFYYQRTFLNIRIFHPIGIAIIAGISVYGLNHLLPATNFFLLMIYPILGLSVFFILMLATKGFTEEDKALFRNVLNPFHMIRYIREEIFGKKHSK